MIKKYLFPAAGYGTRFLPKTKAMPKEMLPVLTRPLIEYGGEKPDPKDAPSNFLSSLKLWKMKGRRNDN